MAQVEALHWAGGAGGCPCLALPLCPLTVSLWPSLQRPSTEARRRWRAWQRRRRRSGRRSGGSELRPEPGLGGWWEGRAGPHPGPPASVAGHHWLRMPCAPCKAPAGPVPDHLPLPCGGSGPPYCLGVLLEVGRQESNTVRRRQGLPAHPQPIPAALNLPLPACSLCVGAKWLHCQGAYITRNKRHGATV